MCHVLCICIVEPDFPLGSGVFIKYQPFSEICCIFLFGYGWVIRVKCCTDIGRKHPVNCLMHGAVPTRNTDRKTITLATHFQRNVTAYRLHRHFRSLLYRLTGTHWSLPVYLPPALHGKTDKHTHGHHVRNP